jgi:large subunit ribosomal protein L30
MAEKKAKVLKVTQIKSSHGRLESHQACLRGLGIRRIHQTVEVSDTPENRGMINKAFYMLKVEGV